MAPAASGDADAITRTAVNRYIQVIAKGDADELTALFADHGTIEDPVGSEVRQEIGRAHV